MRKRPDWDFDFVFDLDPANWFGDSRHRRGRRKRRSRGAWFGHGDMKYVILKLLREKPMHGYEIMKELEERTRGCYKPSPGTVYPTLQWLEDEGLVELEVVQGKKIYSLTEDGIAFLEENKSTVEDIFERVGQMMERIFDDPGPDVSRSVGKLVGAAYRAAWRDGRNPERKSEIIAVLDDATHKLEEMIRPAAATD